MRTLERFDAIWSQLFVTEQSERDPGFEAEILRLTRRGMVVAAVLGIFGVAIYVGSYLLSSRPISWIYGTPRAMVLWDELLIVVASLALLAISWTSWGPKSGRLLASLLILLVSAAMIFEDVASGDVTFSTAYLSLGLVIAVGTLPFRPAQTILLGLIVTLAYVIFVVFLPPIMSVSVKGFLKSRIIYMLVLTSLLSGISALLYRSRYEQYQALRELKAMQARLIQSEKMASLGHVTARIAHEIKNPLNFINNFAELNVDLSTELMSILTTLLAREPERNGEPLRNVIADLQLNSQKINEQGKRADAIVRSMMLHARGVSGERRSVKLNSIVDEHVMLAHAGARSRIPDLSIEIERHYDEDVGEVEVAPQEIGRVLINLLNNAFDAVMEKKQATSGFVPVISISTRRLANGVEVQIRDNGAGIPSSLLQKVFDPFFTTKPAGKGTGLGLSISYDIVVNGHGGTLHVESQEGGGAGFVITLPASQSRAATG